MIRTVAATRYVTPLREGGSLPAIVEADDDGLYVLKFRGAGQGARALVAETIAGGIAKHLGLPMPEMVFVELDPELARTEPDPEIQDLIRASAGLNFALDFLPRAITFDPVAFTPDADLASRIVWFDAFVSNVDRTARNTNLLLWHGALRLIDHGASLYFHHGWDGNTKNADAPFALIKDHVLLRWASEMPRVDAEFAGRLDADVVRAIFDDVPESWLDTPDAFGDAASQKAAYVEWLCKRLAAPRRFVEEAIRARA